MAIDLLVQEAKEMSEETLMEVVRFMRFIKSQTMYTPDMRIVESGKKPIRKAGIYRGLIKVSDDFDEPLDDFKEYM